MGTKHLLKFLAVVNVGVCIGIATGCAEKDLYDPDYGKVPAPDKGSYFDFNLRNDTEISVNYGLPGFTALLEVYGENPMEMVDNTPTNTRKGEALFKIFTDENGKYEGKMSIPTSVKSVYLYTESWGLPRCVELPVENGKVSFDMTRYAAPPAKTKAVTRAYDFNGSVPYKIDAGRNLYSLCKWGAYGSVTYDAWGRPINGYVEETAKVGEEPMGNFVERMQSFLLKKDEQGQLDNSHLVKDAATTNLTLKKEASVSVVFVNKDASYHNTFGYYYYKTGTAVDPAKVKKYIVFPNVDLASSLDEQWGARILKCGDKVQLKYFGENGDKAPSDKFPEGYTIGWFIYSDGFNLGIFGGDDSEEIKPDARLITTNDADMKYIALNDKSGKVVIGVEDGGNQSYCDLLFYAESTPGDAIDNDDRPDTDPDKPEKPDAVETTQGTLAFEDIWPDGGDYDMNDVIVEYHREVTFNAKNQVSKIVDTFHPVHDGALYANAFAYQIDKAQLGNISSAMQGVQTEPATSSIIVCPNVKQSIDKVYAITRDFTSGAFNKNDLKPYNPYIIVKYAAGQKSRTEVHLPKYEATSFADLSLIGTGKDAYYIDKEGAYPFAIDIPILDFIPVTEKYSIDTEYPKFKDWADSKGAKYTDWYIEYEK